MTHIWCDFADVAVSFSAIPWTNADNQLDPKEQTWTSVKIQ